MIKIIGLGPGNEESLTIGALRTLKKSDNIYFRTIKHPTVDYLKEEGIKFNTLDHHYEENSSFDDVYEAIAVELISAYEKSEELVYAVPGHPLVAEKSVFNLMNLCDSKGIKYEIVPAVSFVDAMMESLKIDPIEGLKIVDAFDIDNQILDKRTPTIITQVYNQFIASEVKLKLCEAYNDETKIIFVRAAGVKGIESIREIPLYELDRQEDIDYLTSIYIPKDLENKKDFYDLISIVKTLRSDNGCPWDREQTHESIKSCLIEESYEVLDAIENEDDENLVEELGDVLLQVVFHGVLGEEEGYFNCSDIINGICYKMINRHPHVFGDVMAETTEEVLSNWDEIKKKEKGVESLVEELKGITKALPSITRATKIQKKVKKVGFDWDNVEDAIEKVKEELEEVIEVYNKENKDKIIEELGDLFFACVNVSRFLDVDGEIALNKACEKFINRFKSMEEMAKEDDRELTDMNLQEMDIIWEKVKSTEKKHE